MIVAPRFCQIFSQLKRLLQRHLVVKFAKIFKQHFNLAVKNPVLLEIKIRFSKSDKSIKINATSTIIKISLTLSTDLLIIFSICNLAIVFWTRNHPWWSWWIRNLRNFFPATPIIIFFLRILLFFCAIFLQSSSHIEYF